LSLNPGGNGSLDAYAWVVASAMAVMMMLAWCIGSFIGRRFGADPSPPAPSDRDLVSSKLLEDFPANATKDQRAK